MSVWNKLVRKMLFLKFLHGQLAKKFIARIELSFLILKEIKSSNNVLCSNADILQRRQYQASAERTCLEIFLFLKALCNYLQKNIFNGRN